MPKSYRTASGSQRLGKWANALRGPQEVSPGETSEPRSVKELQASPRRSRHERPRLRAAPHRRTGQVIRRSRAAPRRLPPPCRPLGCAPNPRRLESPLPAQSRAESRRPEHAHARRLCDAPAPLERYERSAAPALSSSVGPVSPALKYEVAERPEQKQAP